MSWPSKILGESTPRDPEKLWDRRGAQFEQIIRNYGRFLDLIADASDKQGGGFIMDHQYINALAESVFNLAKAVGVDFTCITGKKHLAFFDHLERLEAEARQIVSAPDPTRVKPPAAPPGDGHPSDAADPGDLAEALSSHQTLYRDVGKVASRGVAAGVVFNLQTESDLAKFPPGGIWVARDLDQVVELSRVLDRVGGIVCDHEDASGYACRLARSRRLPAIVGWNEATRTLRHGDPVTVDAQDNIIYQGLVPQLVQYYRMRLGDGPEEEYEFQVLRRLRRRVFPLTISEVWDRAPGFPDVKTIHDLVHLAHELAGEALAELAQNKRMFQKQARVLEGDHPGTVMILDRGESGVQSRPLTAFLAGVALGADGLSGKKTLIQALTGPDQTVVMMPYTKGFDMLAARMTGNPDNDYVYCRFDSRSWDLDHKFIRRDVVLDVLGRLGFAAAQTHRAVTAWKPRLEGARLEETVRFLGQLSAFLRRQDHQNWSAGKGSDLVAAFIRETPAGK